MANKINLKQLLALLVVLTIMGLATAILYIYLKPEKAVNEFKKECVRQKQEQSQIVIDNYSLEVCNNVINKSGN